MTNERKTCDCPYCKEEIKVDAIKCKHCGSSVEPKKPAHDGTCPYCKETIHPEAIKCKHCKSNLVAASSEAIVHDEMQGLGDAVARFTTFFGLKPCTGCKRHQEYLNNLLPFSRPS